jgi:MFS family permease
MLLLMLCIGVVQAMVPTPIFALLPEVTSPERLGVSFGIISTCLNLGIMMGPAAAGFMRYATGSYQASYALMAGLAFLIPMVMLQLRHR